jgi:phage-related holin
MGNLMYKIVVLLSAFFLPIYPAMIAVGILITIDTLTGILASNKKGEKIQSRRLGRVLVKMLLYNLLIISAHLCEVYLVDIPFVKITLAFLAITEFLSIGENFTVITGKDFIQYIKSWLMEKLNAVKK